MNTFESITQYNKKFDDLFVDKSSKGFACGFFSIMTAYSFMNNNNFDKESHENNIESGIRYTINNKIFEGFNFDKLIQKTSNLNINEILSTSVELINAGILSYEHIFDINHLDKYAIIFLKNEKFFVVMYNKNHNKYYLRDCHESLQYTFDSLDDLIIRLDTAYQFGNNIDILNDEYIAYSSIEFIKITKHFEQYIKLNDNKYNDDHNINNKYNDDHNINNKYNDDHNINNNITINNNHVINMGDYLMNDEYDDQYADFAVYDENEFVHL
jgi:hypothetical protein